MRLARLSLAVFLLAGCASAPATRALPKGHGAAERAALIADAFVAREAVAPMAASPAPPAPITIDDFRIPSERSCLLEAAALDYVSLRFTSDGPDFAFVAKVTNARVHVTADPVGTGLVVELDKGRVALAGITPTANMAVYTKRAIALGGFFLPNGGTGLRVAGASTGKVLLEAASIPFDLRDPATMLRTEVPCDGASLRATSVNARASLGKALGRAYLRGAEVPLSLTANGAPIATLVSGPRAAEILERSEGAARIVWRVDGGYVTGWVPETELGAKPTKDDSGRGEFGGARGVGEGSSPERRVCNHDVPLGVKLGEAARFVGRIRAGGRIELWGSPGGKEWVGVAVEEAEIQLQNGANMFVRTSDLEGCTPLPSKPVPQRRQRSPRRFINF